MSTDSARRGLFDGFEGYRSPTPEDYGHVLTRGLVVPDANVLLNLYRYNSETRSDLFSVLEKLGDRLWVPQQVLVEFWRNRESALRDPQDSAESTAEALNDQREQAIRVLRTWANRIALAPERFAELQGTLEQAFGALDEAIRGLTDAEEADELRDTNRDTVLATLERVLEGRVGELWDTETRAAKLAEGLKRADAGIPPGYRDKDKGNDLAAGDYLLWEQVLREAERRKTDVLFVTGDVKDDWWRRERGQVRGPRLELVEEMRERASVRLFMLRPESLLLHAGPVLEVEVRKESVQDVERVDRVLSTGELGGWDAVSVQEFLDRLSLEAPVQASAIRLAAKSDGFVTREAVYALGGYDPTRTLRGFSRPANRIPQEFRERGIIPDGAVDLLEAVYDPKISYVQASGFRIPREVIPLIPDQTVHVPSSPAESSTSHQ